MTRTLLTVVLLIVLFGIGVPWVKRYDFLDPVMLAAYFCLPLVLVAPVAANAFAGSAESTSATVTAALRVAFFGWGVGMAIIAAGLITVNAVSWHGHVLAPGVSFLASCAFFSASAALASVVAAGLLAHLSSARVARTVLRLVFLAILIALVLLVRGASPELSAAFWSHTTSAELASIALYAGLVLVATGFVALAVFARLRRIE
jgi:hypothetical protein